EPERRDAERADAVVARERDGPPVAPRHVDDLAVHAELFEVAGGAARTLGNGLARTEHADRDGKRLRTDVRRELALRGFDVDHSAWARRVDAGRMGRGGAAVEPRGDAAARQRLLQLHARQRARAPRSPPGRGRGSRARASAPARRAARAPDSERASDAVGA